MNKITTEKNHKKSMKKIDIFFAYIWTYKHAHSTIISPKKTYEQKKNLTQYEQITQYEKNLTKKSMNKI